MSTRYRGAFHLTSDDVSSEEFQALLQEVPAATEHWVKGQTIRGKLLHPNSGVTLCEFMSVEEDLSAVVSRVLDAVEPARTRIDGWLRRGFEAELACTAYVANSSVPTMNLAPGIMARIATLGATLDLDVISVSVPELAS